MIAELGHVALIAALVMACFQAVLPFIQHYYPLSVAHTAASIQCILVALAFAALTYSFIRHDFSLVYVATNSHALLPLRYCISAVWGAHEGSLLLWLLILNLWTVAVSHYSRHLPELFAVQTIAVLAMVSIGFLLFILLTSNPFERVWPPLEGQDLNPLLQDIGLILHPPALYMGYVGLAVPFAFAISALWQGKLDQHWANWVRPWMITAWAWLTIGIALGSWWAYYELGWGGWWFWDPVENASFIPWLVATALIHALAATAKRDVFKGWTILLAILAFSLSLMGTFLVRSGVLSSVHAFASDPARGVFILCFLTLVVMGSLILYSWRTPSITNQGNFTLLSRETFLLLGNVLLTLAAGCVLLGTLYPLIIDIMGLGKISVGAPYFNRIFLPLMVPVLVMMGIGPEVRWKEDRWLRIFQPLLLPLLLTLACIFGMAFFAQKLSFSWLTVAGLAIACWVISTMGKSLWLTLQSGKGLTYSFIGMTIAHIGIAITTIGITMISTTAIEQDARMAAGDIIKIGRYSIRMDKIDRIREENYMAVKAYMTILDGQNEIARLHPEKRFYPVSQSTMTEAGIQAGIFRDIYVSMGNQIEEGVWAMRLHIKPFSRWLWIGAAVMALGGITAISDKRYRRGTNVNT